MLCCRAGIRGVALTLPLREQGELAPWWGFPHREAWNQKLCCEWTNQNLQVLDLTDFCVFHFRIPRIQRLCILLERIVGFFLKLEKGDALFILFYIWQCMSKTTPDAQLKQAQEGWQYFSLPYFCLQLVGNGAYYFNKLLGSVVFVFPSTFLRETSAACQRTLCKRNAPACWANCCCYKFNIVNSWHNPDLVAERDFEGNKFLWCFRFCTTEV